MILFKKETVGAKLYRVFWLLVGIAGAVGGFNKLMVEGVGSFIPWTVFLIGVAIALMATFGPQEMLKAIQL